MAKKKSPNQESDTDQLLDPVLLQLLVCPLTKQRLHFNEDKDELISSAARLAYPVRGGVPIMLPSEARPLDDGDLSAYG